ncbi:hypothetical protein J6590_094485 [Homalodisca vitripennis]|nr:hypothetical protein J6590_094485 [Homalodisca vitripennis]
MAPQKKHPRVVDCCGYKQTLNKQKLCLCGCGCCCLLPAIVVAALWSSIFFYFLSWKRNCKITGISYLDALELCLLPQTEEDEPQNFIQQQEGALPYWHNSVRNWMNVTVQTAGLAARGLMTELAWSPCCFLDHVVFNDESTFNFTGHVNTLNVHIWDSENPHEMNYVYFLKWKKITTELHLAARGTQLVERHCTDSWIGCKGLMTELAWSPCSPDLTCNFYLWGFINDCVYVSPLPAHLPGNE